MDKLAKLENATLTLLAQVQNITMEDVAAVAEKPEAMTEALIVGAAMFTIALGSNWSVSKKLRKQVKGETCDEKDDEDEVQISAQEAAMFPIAGSAVLLSLYMCYKLIPKEYFNMVLSVYFMCVATFAAATFFREVLKHGVLSGLMAMACSGGWWYTRHFALNNAIAFCICVTALWKMKLPTFAVSWGLLWGLFIYDIWWVFGTEVMVSVARNIEAPMMLKMPKDLTAETYDPKKMMMLGLGDIVIPGFFIAMLLRFDHAQAVKALEAGKRTASSGVSKVYYYAAMVCYFLGLVHTVLFMFLFESAQPALLYLVPWLTFGTLIVAVLRGEVAACYAYNEEPPASAEDDESDLPYADQFYNLIVADLFGGARKKAAKKAEEEAKEKKEQ
eukprot:TRINITY_DN27322_c0_g1_i1.p1 TRINITY_DN27322_c0_g1~~TRINITY_DN27322_c0_g1_i1.p1  ORF type:complete len:388 (+),score=229.02 TRINITY_DN27322_c0_g1_i1:59-1222(+)